MVCAYVFRGRTRDLPPGPIPLEFRSTAQMAVQCALSIIDLTIGDSDLTVALAGLPHYFHSMIAYACAFLIKTVMFHREHVNVEMEPTRDKIAKVIQLCNATECGQHHLVRWIGQGLQGLLVTGFESAREDNPSTGALGTGQPDIPGGAPQLHQCRSLGEPSLARDYSRSTTLTGPSTSRQGFSGVLQDEFGPMHEEFNTFPYSGEDIEDSFFISAEAQAHVNHFGLGLGLLK